VTDAIASLGMYPFEHVRASWDLLWERIRVELDDAPARLSWDLDLHDAWHSPDLLLGATCGWPLVTDLPASVRVIGAFDPEVPFASAGTYRSVIVAAKPLSVDEWRARADTVVAVNADDSLSGAISMWDVWGGRPDRVLLTGAHADSLRAVASGAAHLASIDAVTHELMAEAEPTLNGRLHIVGHGPPVPALPLVSAERFAAQLPALRAAIAAAMDDPDLESARRALRIKGFVPLDRSAYEPLLALHPQAS